MKEIQIQFPCPGNWKKLNLTAIYRDANGYTHTDLYTQDNIPEDKAPALEATVAAITGMGEEWQAVQAWANLAEMLHFHDDSETPPIVTEGIMLTIEASHEKGGRKVFTYSDYPELFIDDEAAVAFFKHFTTDKQQ